MQIIDADGHVNDRPCMDEISSYMPPGNRTQVFPSFDISTFIISKAETNARAQASSQPEVMASEYFRRHARAGKIFVGFDGDDHGLGYAVKEAGNESFVFATDFPHESFDAKSCRIEIKHILSREDLTQADKEAILGKNAKRFYGIE